MGLNDYLLHFEGRELGLSSPLTGKLPCGHVGGALHFGLSTSDAAAARRLEGQRLPLACGITRRTLGWLEIRHIDEPHRLLSADIFLTPAAGG